MQQDTAEPINKIMTHAQAKVYFIIIYDKAETWPRQYALISIDGWSSVPAVKKRKANEVFIGVMSVENAPMLKSAY